MPSTELTGTFERLGFVVRLTSSQKSLERDVARAKASLSRLMCNSRLLKRRTSYLYLDLDSLLIWKRTPLEGEPADFQTLNQKLALSLRIRAARFHPRTQDEEARSLGRVLRAQS